MTFVPSSSGNYRLVLSRNTCLDTTACTRVILSSVNSTYTIPSEIAIYPNPTQGEISVDLGNAKEVSFRLSNALGQVIWTKALRNIPLATLRIEGTRGVYFLEVKTEAQHSIFKLIKG